jgi:hypothetical protein
MNYCEYKKTKQISVRWAPVAHILATQEAEIRRIMVQSQPGQIVCKILSRKKKKSQKKGGMTQGQPQYHKKKKERKEKHCGQAPVAHACNPSYSGGRNQEDQSLKLARANSS